MMLLLLVTATAAMAQEQGSHPRRPRYVIPTDAPVITKQADGTVVVNTSSICTDVKGYRDMTPVEIYIKKDKILKIEALRNNETPKYMDMVQPLLDKWNGKKVKEAQTAKVDAITGATFTSKAIIENVHIGLKFYEGNK